MFILKKDLAYDWPVPVRLPQDGGTWREERFVARFRMLPIAELKALSAGESSDAALLLDRVLVGWSDVMTEDGRPLPFTAENKAALLGIVYVRNALIFAFWGSVNQAPEGN